LKFWLANEQKFDNIPSSRLAMKIEYSKVPPEMEPVESAYVGPLFEKKRLQKCPRCKKVLADPLGLGWCLDCGYCQWLEEKKGGVPGGSHDGTNSTAGRRGRWSELAHIPSWFWVLVAGMCLFALASVVPALKLKPSSFERALWTTLQIALGTALMFGAHFWAVMRVAPEDGRVGNKDFVFPFRVWKLVFKHLPEMRMHLWFAGWGLSLAVSALCIIGGLSYWLHQLPFFHTGMIDRLVR
jgi:hypothetical protein